MALSPQRHHIHDWYRYQDRHRHRRRRRRRFYGKRNQQADEEGNLKAWGMP